ncbi:MAG: hypothetical protein ACI4A3_01425 [Lachnospiraceae bacterium]
MSQAKVDKRKYEKKNRKKLEKQRKIKLAVKCIAAALIIGAVIGVPTGIKIYKSQPKFVGDSSLEAFVGNYIDENYASDISGLGTADTTSEEEAVEDELTNAVEEASGSDLEEVDADNVDEVLGTDSTEDSEEADTTEE